MSVVGDDLGERVGVRGPERRTMPEDQSNDRTAVQRRRQLRARSTQAESLLWYAVRGRRLGGLKFRRQHSIGPYVVDFACLNERLVVELDGDYHDVVFEQDQRRQRYIESQGWKVIRFHNEDVLADVEAVAMAIARKVGLNPPFGKLDRATAPSPQPSPPK